MTHTLSEPLLGLGVEWPQDLYLVFHRDSGKYGCYCFDGVYGLAVFTSEEHADRFTAMTNLTDMENLHVSFDEAREVAKSRPLPVVAVMLLDQMNRPEIHYIR